MLQNATSNKLAKSRNYQTAVNVNNLRVAQEIEREGGRVGEEYWRERERERKKERKNYYAILWSGKRHSRELELIRGLYYDHQKNSF